MNEVVSIIVPVHNTSKYLKNCIDSLLEQTYKNIEIITIENGSTDNSLAILKEYRRQIKIEVLKKASLSIARNKGIELSTGKYIAFIDSDDIVEPTFIEKLLTNIEENKSDLSICNIEEIHIETGKKTQRNDYPQSTITKKEIQDNIHQFNYGPTAKLFKKEIITKNNIEFPLNLKYEDIPFVLKYILNTTKISKINETLYKYYIHKESEQTTVDERIFDIITILNLCHRFTDLESFENLYVQTLTTYAIKTRNIKEKKIRQKFIDVAYLELDQKFPNWKQCEYLKNKNVVKRIIQRNKKLVKIYTNIYSKIKGE